MLKKLSFLAGFVLAMSAGPALAANRSAEVQKFQQMAAGGSIPATLLLADAYQRGDGVAQDLVQARHYFEVAAQAGHPQAQTILATFYEQGQGGPKDAQKMIYWLRQAALQNDPNALFMLSDKLSQGDGLPRDARAAYNLLVRCAIQPVWDGRDANPTPVACRFFIADNDLRRAARTDQMAMRKALLFLALAFDDPHAAEAQRKKPELAEALRAARVEYEQDMQNLTPESRQYLHDSLADRQALFADIAASLDVPAILRQAD